MAFDHKDVVEVFIKTLLEKHPELRYELPADLDALKETMSAMLKLLKPDINQNDLRDPDTLKQLTVALVTGLSLHKLALDPNKNFLNKIRMVFDNKKIEGKSLLEILNDPNFDPKLAPALFAKHLSPEDRKQIEVFIEKCCKEIFNDLERMHLIEPKPGQDPNKASKEISEKTEAFINLFGLIGNIAVPVPIFKGNLFGVPDLNPYPGTAQIDLINRTDDTQVAGDPLGLNAATKSNYTALAGDPFVEAYKEELKPEGNLLLDMFSDNLRAERLISTPTFAPPTGIKRE